MRLDVRTYKVVGTGLARGVWAVRCDRGQFGERWVRGAQATVHFISAQVNKQKLARPPLQLQPGRLEKRKSTTNIRSNRSLYYLWAELTFFRYC